MVGRGWEFGNLGTWQLGNLETWKLGKLETWKLGNLKTWELGNLGTCGLRDNFSTFPLFLLFPQLTTIFALPTAGSDTGLKIGLGQSMERV